MADNRTPRSRGDQPATPKVKKTPRPRGPRKGTPLDEHIGRCLRATREAQGLSLETLAAILDDSTPDGDNWYFTRIRRAENGAGRINYNDVHAILRGLGVATTAFYRDAGFVVFPSNIDDVILTDPELLPKQRIGLKDHVHTLKIEAAKEREAARLKGGSARKRNGTD
jgi:transcriptional regulator with XRE-family HTH domain